MDKRLKLIDGDGFVLAGSDKPLSKRGAQDAIKRILGDSYTGHSPRAITTGFEKGCSVSSLMHLSGHSHVSSLREYDRTDFINNNAVGSLV